MRLLSLLALLAGAALAPAADLTRVDRTIKKEPAYRGKPGYCLLVFGPEARQRAWLVLDGNTLYVDRNGDGDLTEAGERVTGAEGGVFRLGALGGHEAELRRVEKNGAVLYLLWVWVGGHKQSAGVPFASRPAAAPVLHFDGPLTMGLDVEGTGKPRELELQAFLGVRGLVRGKEEVATQVAFDAAPPDVHPVAEIEFPAARPGGQPVKARVALKSRC